MKAITDLDEMKLIQIDIMEKIHAFCCERKIVYFLSHGSLLGAVRHGGFIPWDDDIDIFMKRQDYEQFCELFPIRQGDYGLELVNSKSEKYFGRPMTKVVDCRTILYEPNYLGDDPIGVNIDIWPLDGVPGDNRKKQKHQRMIKLLQGLLYGRIVRFSACDNLKKKMAHLLLLPISYKLLVNLITDEITKYDYDCSDEISCYVDPYKKIFQKEWFKDVVLSKFEDHSFFIPIGADQILTTLYGDYMKLPPAEKQQPHHITDAFWK
jgi:lipopolysaccharide cholinephosphotransferase